MEIRTFTAIAVLLLLVSCEKIKYFSNVNVDMPYSKEFSSPTFDSSIRVPSGGLSYSLPPLAVVTGTMESIYKMGLDTDRIVAMRLKSLSQTIVNPHHPDFDFVDSLQVFISASGLPEVLMAQQNNIPDDADSIAFDCPAQDLKDYLLQDTIYLRLQGHFNSVPEASTFKTNFKFGTTASLIK